MTNKSTKCRPPAPSCLLINSPPSDNKSRTWSNRFLHKLTVVAHPTRLQQLHLQPSFFKKWPQQKSTQRLAQLENERQPRSFCLKLCPTLGYFCDSTPSLQQHPVVPEQSNSQQADPDDYRGDTRKQRKCFCYF